MPKGGPPQNHRHYIRMQTTWKVNSDPSPPPQTMKSCTITCYFCHEIYKGGYPGLWLVRVCVHHMCSVNNKPFRRLRQRNYVVRQFTVFVDIKNLILCTKHRPDMQYYFLIKSISLIMIKFGHVTVRICKHETNRFYFILFLVKCPPMKLKYFILPFDHILITPLLQHTIPQLLMKQSIML